MSTRKNRKIFSFYAFLNVPRTGVIPIPADVKILFKADSADARAEIGLLKKEIGYLREGFKRTQEAATVGNNALARFRGETIALTHVFVSSIDDFGGALNQFDRRFLGFHERVDAFTGAIHRLPPEITAVRDGVRCACADGSACRGGLCGYRTLAGRYRDGSPCVSECF